MRRLDSHDLGDAVGRNMGKTHVRRLVGQIDFSIVCKVTDVLPA